jgi:Bacterial SH3 domain.
MTSKSYALFVSGWGLDGKSEAILYATQGPDGRSYWFGVLIAQGGFKPAPILMGPYAVINLAPSDTLSIRSGAGLSYPVIGSFPADTVNIMRTANTTGADSTFWVEVQIPNGGLGWVDFRYLTEYVTHDAFCADGRIPVMIEQLKGSMNQSNGDMFAGLVSIKSGVDVRMWALQPPVNFNRTTASGVFTSTQSYDWGTADGQGGPSVQGTFAELIQPDLQAVFNAPNLATHCDDLTDVFNPSHAWPYGPNLHYYNLYMPGTTTFNFRTWLIGFEYLNGQPFLHSINGISWGP